MEGAFHQKEASKLYRCDKHPSEAAEQISLEMYLCNFEAASLQNGAQGATYFQIRGPKRRGPVTSCEVAPHAASPNSKEA